jgi:hypothetical protein
MVSANPQGKLFVVSNRSMFQKTNFVVRSLVAALLLFSAQVFLKRLINTLSPRCSSRMAVQAASGVSRAELRRVIQTAMRAWPD